MVLFLARRDHKLFFMLILVGKKAFRSQDESGVRTSWYSFLSLLDEGDASQHREVLWAEKIWKLLMVEWPDKFLLTMFMVPK